MKWFPGVNPNTHILLSGLVWILAGIMLNSRAYDWLMNYNGNFFWAYASAGLFLGAIKGKLVFRRIVVRNIDRIRNFEGKRFILEFIPVKSYFLIFFMAMAGYFLRQTSIPREFIAVLYLGIGMALIFSGIQYFLVLRTSRA